MALNDTKTKNDMQDIKYVEEAEESVSTETDADRVAEEKALVRKIDIALLPCIWIMYLLSYMDRTNIGNAKVAGMTEDLNMSSDQYSIALVVFFITYVVFEVPSNLILAKTKPSIFLPTIMFLWGAATMCMAVIKNYGQLVALRTLVGVLEAGFAPGILLILSSWYKKEEQSKRFAVYISAAVLSGAFGGIIAGAITGNLDGKSGLTGWEWLFVSRTAVDVSRLREANTPLTDRGGRCHMRMGRHRVLHSARLSIEHEAPLRPRATPRDHKTSRARPHSQRRPN